MYVPGGLAAYPTTVLMNAIPAQVAGVNKIVMVTPPHKLDGKAKINPYVLVAAKELGLEEIYKVGGAQAIAALAYGTQTVPKIDKIVGPGNIYVTLAKKLLYGVVGIDKLAGPSEVLIIADEDSNSKFIAADILSQAEHDPLAASILVTTSERVAKEVNEEVEKAYKALKHKDIIEKSLKNNGVIFLVNNLNEAADLANQIAPEHLELQVAVPQKLLEKIKHAGAVFLGPYSPETVGDYIAGPNHVLPTGGTARFSSALGVYDFIKKQSIIGYTKPGLEKVRKEISKLTEVEGLDAHGRAVEVRFEG
jgi:histidinol dehydrogenase